MASAKQELFSDSESDVGEKTTQLTINEHYAKAFQYRKEREELERLKAKYGSDYDPNASSDSDESTDSESAESEDEVGEELTPAVDAAILRTLARIKKRDPAIYDSGVNIYGEEVEKVSTKPLPSTTALAKKDKSKPVTLRQLNLEAQLSPANSRSPSPQPLTHVQEQEILRKETIAAFHKAVPTADGEEGDDFLIPREKTKDELEREEEEYKAFLEREVGDLRDLVSVGGSDDEEGHEDEGGVAKDGDGEDGGDEGETKSGEKKKKKKKKKSKGKEQEEKPKKSKAEEDQEFLMNYILNRGWIDRAAGHVPTYNEVTAQAPERRKKEKSKSSVKLEDGEEGVPAEEEDTGLLSDESFDSLADHFEASYNHRFEEPNAAVIATYPRNLDSTLRRSDNTRKDARERKKERKKEELEKKREEVKRLKALKMRELRRKLGMVGVEGGLKRLAKFKDEEDVDDEEFERAMQELDFEADWDPEKHDKQMKGLFEGEDGEEYGDEELKYDEDGKPVWDDDIDIGDIPMVDDDAMDVSYGMNVLNDEGAGTSKKEEKKKKKKKRKKADEDDDDMGVDIDAMDADVKPAFGDDDEEWDGTEEMRKRKLDEYMEQIYALDFNDMVAGMPTRFKYTTVKPDAHALSPVEILMATDKELNEYVGIKKYAPYRQGDDKGRYSKTRQEKLKELKGTVRERIVKAGWASGSGAGGWGVEGERRKGDGMGDDKPKKRLGKKERMKLRAAQGGQEGEEGDDVEMTVADSEEPTQKENKRKRDQEGSKLEEGGKRDLAAKEKQVVEVNGGDQHKKKKRKRSHKTSGEA
ncbi:hypothetical protein CVT24_009812 [Panaeolus cyanescens]|uniref:Kri1-like C-terminal domain-containing protein n=1 Tax=Panaeolus cyanescens TaxID=181874 RepID=A0A409WCV5_9AGAR|nr:hypothetical protein CVT24_009812 [Panaeolus cyanescens]